MLVIILALLAWSYTGPVSAASSTTSLSKTASKTSSATAATHTVAVGADGHNFTPNTVNASVGDIIEYRFYPQNHSVARAAYGQPCIPYEYTAPSRVGFFSGFFPVQLVLTDPPKFQLRVNDTDPILFYCSTPGACLDGMVGVVNPNETFNYVNQHAFTENATQSFSPGENPFPKEELPTTTSVTSSTSTQASTSTSAPSATTSAAAASSHKSGLGTGPIVGIAIGAVAFAALAGVVIYMCGRQKTIREVLMRQSAAPTSSYQPASPGLSEAQYPNMQKTGFSSMLSGRYSGGVAYGPGPGTETESYRSASPPIDERSGMIHGVVMNPASFGNPNPSTGSYPSSPGNTTFSGPSPMYFDGNSQETDLQSRSYPPPTHGNDVSNSVGPHELAGAVPSQTTSTLDPSSPRPFSFTDSESGYARRDVKGLDGVIR